MLGKHKQLSNNGGESEVEGKKGYITDYKEATDLLLGSVQSVFLLYKSTVSAIDGASLA